MMKPKTTLKSPHFSPQTLKFLEKAGRQKSPKWLDHNRSEYESLLVAPLKHLAQHLKSTLGREAPLYHFPQKGIGRIKRPSNRVKERGGSLYRDWMTYSASRPAQSRFEHNPNLFFLMNPEDKKDSVLVAGGLYMPSSRQVKAIRQAIAESPLFVKELKALFASKAFSACFKGGFSSERISSRIPRGFDPSHPQIEWIKLQAFFVWRSYTRKEFISPKFPAIMERDWRQILRLNALLKKALGGPSSLETKESRTSELADRLDVLKHKLRAPDF
ncbi:DUF2461 family protein [Bdellovibrionota bacterium FG-2]